MKKLKVLYYLILFLFRLKDVFTLAKSVTELRLFLVFEFVEQDLAQYLENLPVGLGPTLIQDFLHQILSGVDFLHTQRIVHRDLKPQNLLISKHGQVKLADFGLSRVYGFSMALTSVVSAKFIWQCLKVSSRFALVQVVTLWYRPPEVLLQDTYCSAVDLWSCGCIFAELFSRR